MRRIIASELTTLDGYMEGPNREFVPPPWNDQLEAYSQAICEEADTILYGRVAYEMNKAFWTTSDMALAPRMNALEKVVLSRTLPDNPGWNARVVRGVEEIAALKRGPGRAMVIFGSGDLLSELTRLRLVDEYRFLLSPMLLGGGKRLFEGRHERIDLRLLESRTLDNGVLMLRYVPADLA